MTAANGQRASRSGFVPFSLGLLATSFFAIFAVDVILRLRLVSWFSPGRQFLGYPRHFAGLVIADAVLAALVSALALLTGALLARILRRLDRRGHALAACSAILVSLSVLAELAFPRDGRGLPWLIPSVVSGIVCWICVYALLRRIGPGHRPFAGYVTITVYPALVLSQLTGIGYLCLRGHGVSGGEIILLVILAALAAVSLRKCTSGRLWPAHMAPLVASVVAAAWLLVYSAAYGRADSWPGVEKAGDRPSIVLVVLDTVRADRLTVYGHGTDTTPFLERWAKGAVVAERALSPSGWTSPAHASMFTGKPVSLHGVHYGERLGRRRTVPYSGLDWLPALLAREGYYCHAVSANQLAIPHMDIGFHRVIMPHNRYFDRTLGSIAARAIPLLNNVTGDLRWRRRHCDAKAMSDLALKSLPDTEAPVFLFINLLDAHAPYRAPPCARRALGDRKPGRLRPYSYLRKILPRKWLSPRGALYPYIRYLYDCELRWLDMQLAELLPGLEERLGKDAIIIVTSDHGEELGEEGYIGHERGLSQRLLHVPLLIRGGGLKPGSIEQTFTTRHLFDFILACGKGEPADISRLTANDEFGLVAERYPFVDEIRARPWVAGISGKYKVLGPSSFGTQVLDLDASGFRDGQFETNTPAETTALVDWLDAYWTKYKDQRTAESSLRAPDPKELERLRALGYIR